jgi:hypothetical protein
MISFASRKKATAEGLQYSLLMHKLAFFVVSHHFLQLKTVTAV